MGHNTHIRIASVVDCACTATVKREIQRRSDQTALGCRGGKPVDPVGNRSEARAAEQQCSRRCCAELVLCTRNRPIPLIDGICTEQHLLRPRHTHARKHARTHARTSTHGMHAHRHMHARTHAQVVARSARSRRQWRHRRTWTTTVRPSRSMRPAPRREDLQRPHATCAACSEQHATDMIRTPILRRSPVAAATSHLALPRPGANINMRACRTLKC